MLVCGLLLATQNGQLITVLLLALLPSICKLMLLLLLQTC